MILKTVIELYRSYVHGDRPRAQRLVQGVMRTLGVLLQRCKPGVEATSEFRAGYLSAVAEMAGAVEERLLSEGDLSLVRDWKYSLQVLRKIAQAPGVLNQKSVAESVCGKDSDGNLNPLFEKLATAEFIRRRKELGGYTLSLGAKGELALQVFDPQRAEAVNDWEPELKAMAAEGGCLGTSHSAEFAEGAGLVGCDASAAAPAGPRDAATRKSSRRAQEAA